MDTRLLDRLKAGTASRHEEVEKVVDVFRPGFDAEAYRSLLGSFLGFYEPLEARLSDVHDPPFAALFEPRRKAPKLIADLASLGVPGRSIEQLPRCRDLPPCTRLAEGLGILYVLEGATLGGRIMARHLERTLGPTSASARRFLLPYGDRVAAMWNQFRSFLLARTPEAEEDVVVGSACLTFDRLRDWLRLEA